MAKSAPQPVPPTPPVTDSRIDQVLMAIFGHRMSLWLWGTLGLGIALFFVGRAAAVGSLAVTLINMGAGGYFGYWLHLALEGCLKHGPDRALRPHELLAKGMPDRADRMLGRRSWIVCACVLGATFMKF